MDAQLTVHGPALTDDEWAHRLELDRLVEHLGVGDRVHLDDAVARDAVPALFAEADALVDNMRAGAPDKVVYEAAASCLPVFASNPVFDELLDPDFRFARDSPDELGECLRAFARVDAEGREAVGRALRTRVEDRHSVAGWADGVLRAAGLA